LHNIKLGNYALIIKVISKFKSAWGVKAMNLDEIKILKFLDGDLISENHGFRPKAVIYMRTSVAEI
jgi:hypothetical protein